MAEPVSASGPSQRPIRAVLLATLVVAAAGLWAIGSVPAGSFYDDGIYLTLGRSLAQGVGYRYLNLPGAPAATHYPPGYPALLALCWWLGGEISRVVLLAKLGNALFMAASAGALTWLLAEGGVPPLAAAAGSIAGAIAVPVLAFSTIPFSEPLFLLLLLTAALLTRRAARTDAPSRAAVMAGASWAALLLVRTVGGVMIPVGTLLLLKSSGRRAALTALVVASAAVAPWLIWSARHAADVPAVLSGSYGSYTGWYLESLRIDGGRLMARIAGQNLSALLRPFGVLLSPPGPAWLRWLVFPAGALTLALGAIRLARASALLAGTLVAYLLIVIVWPYPPDRFIWGIWPLITAMLAAGFAALCPWRTVVPWQRWSALAVAVATGLGAGGYIWRQAIGVSHRAWEGPQTASAGAMEPSVRWVRAHAPPGGLIATVNDPLLYLYTGHPSVPVLSWTASEHGRAQSVDTAEANLERILMQFNPALVVMPSGGSPEAFAVERMWRERKRFELVDTMSGGGAVFRPIRPGNSP